MVLLYEGIYPLPELGILPEAWTTPAAFFIAQLMVLVAFTFLNPKNTFSPAVEMVTHSLLSASA